MTYQSHDGASAWRQVYAPNGRPYWRLEMPVPRIHNNILDCVIYLYPSEADAAAGEKIGGSGFLVQFPVPSDTTRSFSFAVTNKHVIESAPVLRINRNDGTFSVLPYTKDNWFCHPDGDDLAIAGLGTLHVHDHRVRAVPRDMLLTKKIVEDRDIGIGDDVYVVG